MNKLIKYGLLAVIILLLGYNSIYIKKLSDVQNTAGTFDAKTFAQKLWDEKFPAKLDSAVEITALRSAIESNAVAAFDKYTHALAIGNYRYALIKANATVDAVNEDNVAVTIQTSAPFKATLVTEFVYGNTLRDASDLVNLKEFPNTSDLNSISEELNKTMREKVVPSFKSLIKQGSKIEITGAVELNKAHIHFDDLEIIPVRVKIIS